MIDLGSLVLAPAMSVFGGPVTVTPVSGAPAYDARGSYSFKPVEIALEDGSFHSTNQPALGIRLSEFAPTPAQKDRVVRKAGVVFVNGMLPDGTYEIADVILDGQGGADLPLRKID